MILQETYTLANGIAMGLGTWFIDNNKAAQAVRTAVELGYRLIDTAQAYGNERGVGEGIRTCGLKREELFVASKVAAEHKTYEDAARSIDETLEKMGLTYLDQMLIHSPQPWREFRAEKRYFQENRAVWRALEDAQATGKVRVIGVSNFLRDDLENLLTGCRVRPAVNQLLLHIAGTDLSLLDYCTQQDIRVEAYSPIAHGEALKNPAITVMAEKYGVVLHRAQGGWRIPGGQCFAPLPMEQEGDWSAAAYWLVLAALGQSITVTGLRQDSRQGDRRALTLCRELPQQVSLRENPDLLPPLALLAALRPDKEIRFTDAARLRHKESDRLAATAALLTALGGRAQETADGLAVRGVACLQGGEVQSAGDHRLAMLVACAAPFCREPVVLRGADCTAKSYPAFWRDYAQLGGKVEHLT